MLLRTPLPFVYTLAPSLGSEFSSSESRAERTTPPLVFGFASHESTADKYVWCSPTWAGIQLLQAFNYHSVMVNKKPVKTIACITGNTQFVIVYL